MIRKLLLGALVAFGFAGAALAQAPTDAQIAHIAYTAGQLDITAGEQALKKSQNAEVIEFANTMIRDHKAVNEQAVALVTKLGVTPEDNPTSQAIAAAAAAKVTELEALEGAAFDKAYMDNEVAYHATVNGALRDTLIPSAQNAELKALLETGLVLFTEHQGHAEHLAATLP